MIFLKGKDAHMKTKRTYFKDVDIVINAGDKMYIQGEYYDDEGKWAGYLQNTPAFFEYIEDEYWWYFRVEEDVIQKHKKKIINTKVYKFKKCPLWRVGFGSPLIKVGGKSIPNEAGETDCKIATVALIAFLCVSILFRGFPLWWVAGVTVWYKYCNRKLYPDD